MCLPGRNLACFLLISGCRTPLQRHITTKEKYRSKSVLNQTITPQLKWKQQIYMWLCILMIIFVEINEIKWLNRSSQMKIAWGCRTLRLLPNPMGVTCWMWVIFSFCNQPVKTGVDSEAIFEPKIDAGSVAEPDQCDRLGLPTKFKVAEPNGDDLASLAHYPIKNGVDSWRWFGCRSKIPTK